jgi:hypothetical protein
MKLEELPEFLEDLFEQIKGDVQRRIVLAGAEALKGEMTERIFGSGRDSDDNKIGDYSHEPAYYSKEQFVRKGAFKAQGKYKEKLVDEKKYKVVKKKLKNGTVQERIVSEKKYKAVKNVTTTMFLKDGYAEFREIQGRQAGYKDFQLSGSLKNNLTIGEEGGNTVLGFTDQRESDKRKGLEEQVKKSVFQPSGTDLQILEQAMSAEIDALKQEL